MQYEHGHSDRLTVTQVLEEILLAREVQLCLDVDGESSHLPGLQGELGQGFFQLPAQEVAIQLFCNENTGVRRMDSREHETRLSPGKNNGK